MRSGGDCERGLRYKVKDVSWRPISGIASAIEFRISKNRAGRKLELPIRPYLKPLGGTVWLEVEQNITKMADALNRDVNGALQCQAR